MVRRDLVIARKPRTALAMTVSGFTLLEVLISLLLLSIILLGLDAVNVSSLRTAKSIWYYRLAELQTENMSEYLRAGHGTVTNLLLDEWNMQNQGLLPKGRGQIEGRQITIFWGDKKILTCDKNIIATSGCLRVSPL